ncbi:MAG: anhydro-N-acetylmuramic acid kinase [Acidobacteriota bacterium]
MRVCGVMSGTSLDGIDVAVIEIVRGRLKPLVFHTTPYPKAVRQALLSVSNTMTHTATIARLHFLLGELYAEAIRETCRRRVPLKSIELCGLHGQTIFHEGSPIEYLGHRIASTLQIGDPSVVAERTGIRTISNFRERDIAAGGKGAPLVPYVDYMLFRDKRRPRVALNIGGIANITVIPAGAAPEDVVAFDTGPGNMILDALTVKLTDGKQRFDKGGRIARKGKVHDRLLDGMLRDPHFRLAPPKTAGREQFGQEFANGLIATGLPLEDLIATATELTARSISLAIATYAPPASEVIASGGGIQNTYLMERLHQLLPAAKLSTTADYGIDPGAKEAIAFAVLAHASDHGQAASLPSATGARRAVVLGRVTPA